MATETQIRLTRTQTILSHPQGRIRRQGLGCFDILTVDRIDIMRFATSSHPKL
jgi:hypothetical protein